MDNSKRRGSRVSRRAFVKAATAGLAAFAVRAPAQAEAAAGELLYNGIRLGTPWPPRWSGFPLELPTPPYLLDRPAVVPIDLGRQLFVDDFLIEETTLSRTFHQATYHQHNPVLRPTTPWELFDDYANRTHTPSSPTAMVFSDGVFYDVREHLYKMWYMGGYDGSTCYATSRDGLSWEKPDLDVKPGTNIVLDIGARDSSTIWLDHDDPDRGQRYKASIFRDKRLVLASSSDGIHWRVRGETGFAYDRSTMFYNPFRRKWVFSLREEESGRAGRCRRYWETDDFFGGANWREGEPVPWIRADAADPRRADYQVAAQLYNLDAAPYESLMLGMFSIWRGEYDDREKPNDVCLGFSRDGFHWTRPDRRPFIALSERVGDWNWANIQSAGGCCLIVGDQLYFYVSGRQGIPGTPVAGNCSTGLAILRRDGFASMDVAPASGARRVEAGRLGQDELVTRPVRFAGGHLFVNADLADGELRAAVETLDGRTIGEYSMDGCVAVRGNGTGLPVVWRAADVARLAGQPVRFRFKLTAGRLYSFWVSPTAAGASGGYVAAGGPGFTGPRDTVGVAAAPRA